MTKVIREATVLQSFIRSVLDAKLNEAIAGAAPVPLMAEEDLNQALQSPTPKQTSDQQPGGENVPEEIDVKAVIEKLNSIRSGRSFRDSAVEERMNAFFSNLDDSEKKALYQFLNGIAQAVTGEVSSENVIKAGDPSNPPANVEMKSSKTKEKAQLSLKPNLVANKPKEKTASGAEDTSAPAPISPKKR
jgi:hypothetical protein